MGILTNGAASLKLRGATSISEKVAGWHLLEDTLGWIAVLVGGGILYLGGPAIIHPLLSIGISLYILWNVLKSLKQVMQVILHRAPASFDVEKFEGQLTGMPKARSLTIPFKVLIECIKCVHEGTYTQLFHGGDHVGPVRA